MADGAAVAVVTGAGGGLGGAIATEFAAQGHVVVVADVNEAAALSTVEAITRQGGRAHVCRVDVTDPDQVAAAAGHVVDTYGGLDVLVNAAGIQYQCPSLELTPADYARVLNVNLHGTVYWCLAAGRHMVGHGGGVIINISSVASEFAWPRRMPYSASKAGVAAVTRSLAVEWAPHNVRVVAIAPGMFATAMWTTALRLGHLKREAVLSEIPQARMGDPVEVARLAVYLASPAAAYITGQEIRIDGGWSVFKM
ncbi:MAG TPA: SDR family NAD(P)-dependent oxidoreductase [bacterium]|nr:SDR family NAD(P)-dependent oxidoreductase [bacterium]